MSKTRLAPLAAGHPENAGLLAYLAQGRPAGTPPVARPSSVPDPYYGCGCHPDVVEHLWDGLGQVLPRASRALVFGTPALVHATAGIVLAVGLGTSYALRLPASVLADPAAAALESARTFRTSRTWLDLAVWGPFWRFGGYQAREREWLAAAAAELDG